MRDLYKQLGLSSLTNDQFEIRTAIFKADNVDKAIGEYILLHEGRKRVYDRTHQNLALIGRLRKELELTETGYWGSSYSDFTNREQQTSYRGKRASSSRDPIAPKSSKPNGDSNFIGNALAFLVVIIVLISIFSGKDNSSPKYSGNTNTNFNQTMHVTSNALNLRQQPNTDSNIVGKLKHYQDINKDTSKSDSTWSYVRTKDNLKGYVSNKYIAKGDGNIAYINNCRLKGVTRPSNGKVIKQVSSGRHQLVVNNSPGADALAKLKDKNNRTVVEFYIRANQTAKVSVPEGSYRFQYASGTEYSPGCSRFLKDMHASQDPSMTRYVAEHRGNSIAYAVQTYTLKRVQHGNFRPQRINASDF